MNSKEQQDMKDRLVDQAAKEIEQVQLTGYAIREQINIAKEQALKEIEKVNAHNRLDDSLVADRRSELIQKMGEAAKAGDFTELQRLQCILKGNNFEDNVSCP